MNAWKISRNLGLALLLCASLAVAQDQKQDATPFDPNSPLQPLDTTSGGMSRAAANKPPIGAARGVDASYDSEAYDPSQVTPDQNTLAGAEPFTIGSCLLYTSPSPRDGLLSRMPSSA